MGKKLVERDSYSLMEASIHRRGSSLTGFLHDGAFLTANRYRVQPVGE